MILLAVVIVLVLVLLYLHVATHDYTFLRERFNLKTKARPVPKNKVQRYQRTVGYALDETAKEAIREAGEKETQYQNKSVAGKLDRTELPDAANNAAIMANLQRYNVAPNLPVRTPEQREVIDRQIGKNYRNAVDRVVANPHLLAEITNNTGPLDDGLMPPEMIIGQAETFYAEWRARAVERGMDPLEFDRIHQTPNFEYARDIVRQARRELAAAAAERRQAAMVLEAAPIAPGEAPFARAVDDVDTVPNVRGAGFARINPGELLPAVQEDFYRVRPVYNDPQNVHDPAVIDHVKGIYGRIRDHNERLGDGLPRDDQILEHIGQMIDRHDFASEEQRGRARQAYNNMLFGNSIDTLRSTDTQVMIDVYKRILSPANTANRTDMQNAFMDSLSDVVENDVAGRPHLVCVTGRCARMLNSLTMLDSDAPIARPVQTTDMVRNEALSKASKILQTALQEAPETVRQGYTDSSGTDEVREFEQKVKAQIENTIRTDYSHLEGRVVDQVVRDAQAGV